MRITEILAENFLSFGHGDDRFHMDLEKDMTVLVGPNGAGKTNVLRIVDRILTSLRDPHPADITSEYHHPAGANRPIVLSIGVAFDDQEQAFMTALLKLALAYPGNDILSGLVTVTGEDGKERGNKAMDDRVEVYRRWVDHNFKIQHFAPLYSGHITLAYDPGARPGMSLRFEGVSPHSGEEQIVVDIYGNNSRDGCIGLASWTRPGGERSLTKSLVDSLGPSEKAHFGRYLDGDESDFPLSDALPLAAIVGATSSADWVSTGVSDFNSQLAAPLPQAFRAKADGLAVRLEHIHLANVIRKLVVRSVATMTEWSPQLEFALIDASVFEMWLALSHLLTSATVASGNGTVAKPSEQAKERVGGRHLVEPWLTTPFTLLRDGNLAAYLFRLRLGDAEEKSLYQDISCTFHDMTSVKLGMRVVAEENNQFVGGTRRQTVVKLVLETEDGIPLRCSGSGVPQALYLAAAVKAFPGTVLFLDEPEIHLHPNLQRRIPDLLTRTAGGQYVVVAHSPYSVPTSWYATARRVFARNGASRTSRRPQQHLLKDKDIKLPTRGQGIEAKAFLFATACVFVEGPNDAAAYHSWFDAWAKRNKRGEDYSTRVGLVFQVAGGTARVGEMIVVAEAFDVPALGLVDTDVLRTYDESTEKGKAQAESARGLLEKYKRLHLMPPCVHPGDVASLRQLNSGCLRILQPNNDEDIIWTMDMECLFRERMCQIKVADGRGAPSAYALIAAEWTPAHYEQFVDGVFEHLEHLATDGPIPGARDDDTIGDQ